MTSGERVVKNLIEGINRAYKTLHSGDTDDRPILVSAIERSAFPGIGVSFANGNGLVLTIAGRRAEFDGEGRLLESGPELVERSEKAWAKARDKKPGLYAQFCRGEITEQELFT